MPVGNETLMDGTTRCPHCDTRFRIAAGQLHARQGMVRCGHCMQIFDARPDFIPDFIPDEPDPQLELPMLDEAPAAADAAPEESAAPDAAADADETVPAAEKISDDELLEMLNTEPEPLIGEIDFGAALQTEAPPPAAPPPRTLAEQIVIVQDDDAPVAETDAELEPERRRPLWLPASVLLLIALLLQAAYLFRVELAVRLPGLKPALVAYCQWLDCAVPLPQNHHLMSIESSELEADPASEARINLNALLRNRASYALAFPDLELTLTDSDDQALARRVFRPADYLVAPENQAAGLRPNRELAVRLHLDIADLRPTGYRLVLFYPQ